jgi:hypothetical protein
MHSPLEGCIILQAHDNINIDLCIELHLLVSSFSCQPDGVAGLAFHVARGVAVSVAAFSRLCYALTRRSHACSAGNILSQQAGVSASEIAKRTSVFAQRRCAVDLSKLAKSFLCRTSDLCALCYLCLAMLEIKPARKAATVLAVRLTPSIATVSRKRTWAGEPIGGMAESGTTEGPLHRLI